MTDRVAVVGAGQMGNGIAHVFAQSGFDVVMIDVSQEALDHGRATVAKNIERQVKKGTIPPEEQVKILSRIDLSMDLEAVSEASLIIEAASEDSGLKYRIFTDLDRIAKADAVLATNTSSISITEIGRRTSRPDKVIGMHFMNPVPVMKLVEIIRGLATSDTTTKYVMEIAQRLGKTAVEVNDYPGFVSNRVLMPMINEAVYCLMEGVGTPEAIDQVMTHRMVHAERHHLIDCFRSADAFHQAEHRFVDHRHQDAIRDEARIIIHFDGRLPERLRDVSYILGCRVRGRESADDLDELHHRHRIHEVHADDFVGARRAPADFGDRD